MRLRSALVFAALAAATGPLDAAEPPLAVRSGTLLDPGNRVSKTNMKIFFEGEKVARVEATSAADATMEKTVAVISRGRVVKKPD
ncbi:MAG TPA: hypothetical protein VMN04_05585 [Thermoanaerobaculia bacterium]|nr:hypothetical protein [Thermoanaerobaculia bacterium]